MAQIRDEGNLQFVTSSQGVDQLNEEFYATYQYPWAPMAIEKLADPYFDSLQHSQSIGSWDKNVLPANPRIWVAGCGTNQAALTAVRFPKASVTGSDLSPKSLETCADTAKQIGLSNLNLKKESISDVTYADEFDYVICTGVIHHTADPQASLLRLAKAVKPSGLMLLMVYNRYHRIEVTSFQKAVRILERAEDKPDFRLELQIAKKLLSEEALHGMADRIYGKDEDSALADMLIQPVEYGYTVESFEALAAQCGLEMLAPYADVFAQAHERYLWNMSFGDPELQERYDSLPDTRRWQVSNLLLGLKSPMLYFYFQRKDSGRPKQTEQQICEGFLDHTFTKNQTERQVYMRRPNGIYELLPSKRLYPGLHPDSQCQEILEQVAQAPSLPMREILKRLNIPMAFHEVNKLRIHLATLAFPFLRSSTLSV